jgi:hypothetical protein
MHPHSQRSEVRRAVWLEEIKGYAGADLWYYAVVVKQVRLLDHLILHTSPLSTHTESAPLNSAHFCSYVIWGAHRRLWRFQLSCPLAFNLTDLLLLPASLLTLTYTRHHKWTRPKNTVDCVVSPMFRHTCKTRKSLTTRTQGPRHEAYVKGITSLLLSFLQLSFLLMTRRSPPNKTQGKPSVSVACAGAADSLKRSRPNARALDNVPCAPKARPATASRTKTKVGFWALHAANHAFFDAHRAKRRSLFNSNPVMRNSALKG